MTNLSDAEAVYRGARTLMESGELEGAKAQFVQLIDAYKDDHNVMRDGLEAQVECSYAVCLRDTGDAQAADFWFRSTAHNFANSGDEEARYVAAQADFLRALMMRDAGQSAEARDLFDTVSMRIMMEEHPATRAVFHAAMDELKALEAQIGPALQPAEAKIEAFTYRKRASVTEKEPRSWCFEPERIICTRNSNSYALTYGDIHKLEFAFNPTRFAPWRYVLTIHSRTGAREEIDNAHFESIGNFTEQSIGYRTAVSALVDGLKNSGTTVEIVSGKSWPYYGFMLLLTVFVALVFLLTLLVGGPIGIIVKLVLVTLFVPTLFRWFKRNVPRRGTLDALPPGSLPS
jgi:hypothetical protein